MKYSFEFLQTGGVPLTNDLMALIEEAYGIFETLADVAGNLTILSGAEITGSTVKPGIVAIEGKLYYFEGGTTTSKVYINTEEIQETFQDQTTKTLIKKRTVKFGQSTITYNWTDFVRLESLKGMMQKLTSIESRLTTLEQKTAPIINGGIVLPWFKPFNEIPAGWKECTDLRGKTIVGLDPNDNDFSTLKGDFGTKTHLLTENEMPSHTHSINDPGHKHKFGASIGWSGGSAATRHDTTKNFDTTTEKTGITINNTGGSQPHNNVQPSKIAYYIEPNFL